MLLPIFSFLLVSSRCSAGSLPVSSELSWLRFNTFVSLSESATPKGSTPWKLFLSWRVTWGKTNSKLSRRLWLNLRSNNCSAHCDCKVIPSVKNPSPLHTVPMSPFGWIASLDMYTISPPVRRVTSPSIPATSELPYWWRRRMFGLLLAELAADVADCVSGSLSTPPNQKRYNYKDRHRESERVRLFCCHASEPWQWKLIAHPYALLQQHYRGCLSDLVLDRLRVGEEEYRAVVRDAFGRPDYRGKDIVRVGGDLLVCLGTGLDAVEAGH